MRTVNACVSSGIRDLVTVHGYSFGCLVPQVEEVAQIVRDEFVRMYEEHDPLEEIYAAALSELGSAEGLPQAPARGTFNIREASQAYWGFWF